MRRGLCWLIAGLLAGTAPGTVVGAEGATSPAAAPDTTRLDVRALPGVQVGDEPIEPFDPLVPPPSGDEQHRQARAWYMSGKIHEARASDPAELIKAVAAYRKAVELDPTAAGTYEALIPVLYAQGQKAEARTYALQAARQSARGWRIVRGLSAVMARGDSVQDAIALLQSAIALPDFDAQSVTGLLVHRDLGMYLHMAEQPAEASKSYELVFNALLSERDPPLTEAQRKELLPDPGATYDEFGKTFLEAKLADLAVRAFDEAAKHRTSRPGIHSFNLALVFRETGKAAEALAELQKYFDAQLQSKGRDAYQLLKDLLADLGRSDELLPKLQELKQSDPRNAFLAYFVADEYVARGEIEQAQSIYEETLGESSDPRGLVGLIPVYRKQQKSKELVGVLGKLYPQIPEDRGPENMQKLSPDARVLVERYEQEFEALSQDTEALKALLQAGRDLETASPSKIEVTQAYVLGKLAIKAELTDDAVHFYKLTMSMLNQPAFSVYTELGSYLVGQRKYAAAAEVFREAADHPGFEQARWILLFYLTHALELDGKTEDALKANAEARGSQPDNARLHFQQAWVYYHAQRWDEAEPILKAIITDYKGEAENEEFVRDARFSLSNLYVQKGEVERGEQVLLDVLKELPNDPQANNDLGYLWADKGKNLTEARGMIEKALQQEPDNHAYLDSMGWVLYRLGEYAEARTYLEKATQAENGDDSTVYDHLGDVLDKLDLKAEAAVAWKKALELEQAKSRPDEELVKKVEAKLNPAAAAGDQPAPTP